MESHPLYSYLKNLWELRLHLQSKMDNLKAEVLVLQVNIEHLDAVITSLAPLDTTLLEGEKNVIDSTLVLTEEVKVEERPVVQTKAVKSKKYSRIKQPISKPSPQLLDKYKNRKLLEIIETILKDNFESILSTDYVTQEMYGELSPQEFKYAKQQIVSKHLSAGYVKGLWYRVIDQQGYYTANISLISPH